MQAPLNENVEYMTKANSTLTPLLPKSGHIYIGETGLEYRAESGSGFIQIPWINVKQIRAQLFFGGRYVRGFYVATDDDQLLEFIVADGKNCLRAMRQHLDRSQFVVHEGNLTNLFKRK